MNITKVKIVTLLYGLRWKRIVLGADLLLLHHLLWLQLTTSYFDDGGRYVGLLRDHLWVERNISKGFVLRELEALNVINDWCIMIILKDTIIIMIVMAMTRKNSGWFLSLLSIPDADEGGVVGPKRGGEESCWGNTFVEILCKRFCQFKSLASSQLYFLSIQRLKTW